MPPAQRWSQGGLPPPGHSSMVSVVLLPDVLVHGAHGKEAFLWGATLCGPTFLCQPRSEPVTLLWTSGARMHGHDGGSVGVGPGFFVPSVSSGRWVCPSPSRGRQVFRFLHSVLYRAQPRSLSRQGGRALSWGPCGLGLALGSDTPRRPRRDDCDPRLPCFSQKCVNFLCDLEQATENVSGPQLARLSIIYLCSALTGRYVFHVVLVPPSASTPRQNSWGQFLKMCVPRSDGEEF